MAAFFFCHKMSLIVADCHSMSQIVIRCRKLSWFVACMLSPNDVRYKWHSKVILKKPSQKFNQNITAEASAQRSLFAYDVTGENNGRKNRKEKEINKIAYTKGRA